MVLTIISFLIFIVLLCILATLVLIHETFQDIILSETPEKIAEVKESIQKGEVFALSKDENAKLNGKFNDIFD
jgi:hypothetical protein